MKKILSLVTLSIAFLVSSFTMVAQAANQVQALHILVPSEEQAIMVRQKIVDGADKQQVFQNFMSAARQYSKCPSGKSGGILGWFGKGDMVKPFEDAAFSLPNGEVSEPVKTQFGWHLIYVISKK